MINSYKDLVVWQSSITLVKQIYTLTEEFPKSELNGSIAELETQVIISQDIYEKIS